MASRIDIKHHLSLILLVIPLMLGCVQRQAAPRIDEEQLPSVTVEELMERLNSGSAAFVLDVRTPEEYDGPLGHIEGSHLIPVQELARRLSELSGVKDQHIFVICHSGGRSARATRILLNAGFQVANVAGGMQAWSDLVETQSESAGNPD